MAEKTESVKGALRAACVACGRVVAAYVPRGGDGSALHVVRHAPTNRLSGSMRPARERAGTWGVCAGSNQKGDAP